MFGMIASNRWLEKSLITPLILALLIALPSTAALWPQEAQAHKGHGGSMVTLMKKKKALKAMLPLDAKLTKRKERLSEDAAKWADDAYKTSYGTSLYTYYLARDRNSGNTVGAAIIDRFSYRHGDVLLAVGIDSEGRTTKVAITAISEKYIPDFEGSVGTGFITQYEGKSLEELLVMSDEMASADKPNRDVATKVREAAVLLNAFMKK